MVHVYRNSSYQDIHEREGSYTSEERRQDLFDLGAKGKWYLLELVRARDFLDFQCGERIRTKGYCGEWNEDSAVGSV